MNAGWWVECRAAASALISADFHSKERITLYFFGVKDLIYTYVNRVTSVVQTTLLALPEFFMYSVAWSLWDNIA